MAGTMAAQACADWRAVLRFVAVAIVLLNVCAFVLELLRQAQRAETGGSARLARHLVVPQAARRQVACR